MAIRKIKLSDTQAHVIAWSTLGQAPEIDGYISWGTSKSRPATFQKLHALGLIAFPWEGASLTLEGVNVRRSLQTDALQRTFHVSDEISSEAYVIQPVGEQPTDCTCSKGAPSPGNVPCLHCGGDNSWCSKHYPAPQMHIEPVRVEDADSVRQESTLYDYACQGDCPEVDNAGFYETPTELVEDLDKRIMAKVFPKATEQDTETHFIGSGALSFYWWENLTMPEYQADGYTAVDGWSMTGQIESGEDDTPVLFEMNHRSIQRAIRKIATLGTDEEWRTSRHISECVFRECQTWIFKGPDDCDFDAPMADSVMQFSVLGDVVY